jgi:tetratricopeptide (TPR) repeat protein
MHVSLKKNFAPIHTFIKLGKFSDAINELLDSNTGRIKANFAPERNHAWYCIGDCKFRTGDLKGAILAFRNAFKADTGDAQSLLAIGNCYDAQKKPRLAERYFRQALTLHPTNTDEASILVNLGNALIDQNRWMEAIEYLTAPSERKDKIVVTAKKNLSLVKARLKAASIDVYADTHQFHHG